MSIALAQAIKELRQRVVESEQLGQKLAQFEQKLAELETLVKLADNRPRLGRPPKERPDNG